MAQDPLDELLQFLQPEARVDLKIISLVHLLTISGTESEIEVLLNKDQIIQSVIELSDDKVEEVCKNALFLLVNICATPRGASELLKYRPSGSKNVVKLFIDYVLDQNKRDADAVCMILLNLTRQEDLLEVCVDTFLPMLNDLLHAFADVDYNKRGANLNYLAPMFSNLSCSVRIQRWLTEENPRVPLIKLLPFCDYASSEIRRGGVVGTIRNLSFDSTYHEFLLSNELDLLTYLLTPLMGNEEYPDDEMEKLPITLQYLPKEKRREEDTSIRKMVLETLNKLCAKRRSREYLRDNGVYYVLREYHKWEKDPTVLLACENVVDILIQKEEVGAEDLTSVEVTEDMTERFQKMDEDYVESI